MKVLIWKFLDWLKNWFLRCPHCKHVHKGKRHCGTPIGDGRFCGCQTDDEA